MPQYVEEYRGHDKHKSRPTQGVKGTRCPEWTHLAEGTSVGNHMFAHRWQLTRAQELLDTSIIVLKSQRRFTTGGGIAFEVKSTHDGTYHGYPVPWDDVPLWLQQQWRVTSRQIGRYSGGGDDQFWAMGSVDG